MHEDAAVGVVQLVAPCPCGCQRTNPVSANVQTQLSIAAVQSATRVAAIQKAGPVLAGSPWEPDGPFQIPLWIPI